MDEIVGEVVDEMIEDEVACSMWILVVIAVAVPDGGGADDHWIERILNCWRIELVVVAVDIVHSVRQHTRMLSGR